QRWLKTFFASTAPAGRDVSAPIASAAQATSTRIARARAVVHRQLARSGNVGSRGVPCRRSPTTDSSLREGRSPAIGLIFRVTVIVASGERRALPRSDVRRYLTCPYCQQESAQHPGNGLLGAHITCARVRGIRDGAT